MRIRIASLKCRTLCYLVWKYKWLMWRLIIGGIKEDGKSSQMWHMRGVKKYRKIVQYITIRYLFWMYDIFFVEVTPTINYCIKIEKSKYMEENDFNSIVNHMLSRILPWPHCGWIIHLAYPMFDKIHDILMSNYLHRRCYLHDTMNR